MEERPDEGTARSSNDPRDRPVERCEHCGRSIETSDWYPLAKDRDAEGSLRIYVFCSDDCHAAWLDERPE